MKAERLKKGISQQELATVAGCSLSLVQKIERGVKTPSMKLAGRLSRVLGKSVDVLFLPKNETKSAGR